MMMMMMYDDDDDDDDDYYIGVRLEIYRNEIIDQW